MPRLFRKRLVPHDFSEHATRALRFAAELARAHGSRLSVLRAITPFNPVTGFPAAEEMAWIPPADLVSHEQTRLEALVRRNLSGRNAPRADVQVVVGDPFQQIMDAASSVELIVMATAGRTGLAHLLIGSVAEKVVRHSPVPVLTLRPPAARRARSTRPRTGRRRR